MTHALPLRRIVVGVDGSAASAAAVRWAVREARLRHATVHLVCAYHGDTRLHAPYVSSAWTRACICAVPRPGWCSISPRKPSAAAFRRNG